jgi:tRNA dimethylallyltransferase
MTTQAIGRQLHTPTPLIAVVGFTASGKSALGMHLAKQFSGEIIAADAMTVYRKFDIGTAKPTKKEQSEIQHHLLDIADATAGFSAAEFKQRAEKSIADIAARGKLPILVGGSGLYVDSILYDYDFRKVAADTKKRAELNAKSVSELIAIAQANQLDTKSIDSNNKRRLIRLIETNGQTVAPKPLRKNTLVLGINVPREVLRERVVARVEHMLEQGLEDEVRTVSDIYGWDVEPMRSIGYREWQAYFAGSKSLNEVKDELVTHTMQLAKKQRTWFRRNGNIKWVNNFDEAVEHTTTFLNT